MFRQISSIGPGANPNRAGRGSCPVSASARQQSHQGGRDKQTCQSFLPPMFLASLVPRCCWLGAVYVLDPAPPPPAYVCTRGPSRVGLLLNPVAAPQLNSSAEWSRT